MIDFRIKGILLFSSKIKSQAFFTKSDSTDFSKGLIFVSKKVVDVTSAT
jgi:hypothetical protein